MQKRYWTINRTNNTSKTHQFTSGLEIVATWHLHIERNEQGQMLCEFKQTRSQNAYRVDLYVTGDLAFQAMALGKESMAGWWCMLCKSARSKFMNDTIEMWTMEEYMRCGSNAESSKGKPQLGVKQWPW
jgi:hypothetical protein